MGWGHLALERFQQFIEDNPQVRDIELSSYGEIFLNPDLIGIIRYGYQKDIGLAALNGVNLNTVTDDALEALVKYKVAALNVSIDGASQEIYGIYRKNGNFETVIRNVKKLNEYKRQYNSPYPRLWWQFIVFGHNEHEIPLAREMASRLDMTFIARLSWSPSYSPLRNRALVSSVVGRDVETPYRLIRESVKACSYSHCARLWTRPQINWDGKVLGCCVNRWGDFGNVFQEGLEHCLKSEKYRYAKGMVLGENRPRKDIPCYHCRIYRQSIYPRYAHRFLLRGGLSQLRYLVSVFSQIAKKLLQIGTVLGYGALLRILGKREAADRVSAPEPSAAFDEGASETLGEVTVTVR